MQHLLKHLEHFLSSLFSSKEFYAALIGAVIGGLLTGRFALRAQKQAAEDQRQRDQETEQRAVKGTLRAIAAELRVFKSDNCDKLQKILKERQKLRESPLPLAMTRTEQNYCTVFESNAGALGRINDAKLREDIVRVYGHVKGLVDILNANSRDFEHWRNIPAGTSPDKLAACMNLAELEPGIRDGVSVLQCQLDEVLKKIEEYLNS